MNTNSAVIGGIVIVALLLLGGLYWYSQSTPPATTPTDTTGGNGTTPTTREPGSPVATTNQNVTPTDTPAVVVGGVVPNGAITTYWYEYGTSANLGQKTANQTIGSGYANLAAPAFITQLVKDTTYYYRLVAENQFGKSTGTTYTFRTTVGTPAPVGSAPTVRTLPASGIARTAATANGEVTPNRSSTRYWFEYGTSGN